VKKIPIEGFEEAEKCYGARRELEGMTFLFS
jgi:hypothetical protein